tara:strand:+ start:147 stop:605 length:459 start_codon:yes stop_codon:yes gene_type:complete
MIQTIIKAFYSVFVFIVLVVFILVGWTAYSFISQPSKSDQILRVIKDMYGSQKSVIFDFIDLTKILINEKDLSVSNNNISLSTRKELLKAVDDNSQLNESPVNQNNSLIIGIEPSPNEFGEEILPGNIEEPIVNEEKGASINEMTVEMDINP